MAFTPEEFQCIEGYFGSTQPRLGSRCRHGKQCKRNSIDSVYSVSGYDTEYETLSQLLYSTNRRAGQIFSDKFTVIESVLKISLMRRLRSLVNFSNTSFTSSKFTSDSGFDTACSNSVSPEYSEATDSDGEVSNNLLESLNEFNSYDFCEEYQQHEYASAECPVENVYQDPDVVMDTKSDMKPNIYQDPNLLFFDPESSFESSQLEESNDLTHSTDLYENTENVRRSLLFNTSGETIASISTNASCNNGTSQEYLTCTIHQNQALTLFCSSCSCKVAACGICAVQFHKGSHHKLVAISQIPHIPNDEDVAFLSHKIKDHTNLIRKSIRQIDNKGKQLNTNLTLIQKEVMKSFQNCRHVLDQREQEVLTEVSLAYRDLRGKIFDRRSAMKNSLTMLDGTIWNRTRSLGKTKAENAKHHQIRNTLNELNILEDNNKNIGIMGYIRSIDTFTTALKGVGNVIILRHKPTLFIIDKGIALQGWQYNLHIELAHTEGYDARELLTLNLIGPTGQSLPTELTSNNDGTHSISFTPHVMGTYKLTPTVFGHTLLDKPINIPVWVPTLVPEHHGNTRPYRVKVVAMDSEGCAQMLPPNLPIVARFIYSQKETYCNLSYSEGKYCITYNLRKAGNYTMNITLQGQHINYSPMQVTYQTRPVHKVTIHSDRKSNYMKAFP